MGWVSKKSVWVRCWKSKTKKNHRLIPVDPSPIHRSDSWTDIDARQWPPVLIRWPLDSKPPTRHTTLPHQNVTVVRSRCQNTLFVAVGKADRVQIMVTRPFKFWSFFLWHVKKRLKQAFFHRFLDITNKWIWRILEFRKKILSFKQNLKLYRETFHFCFKIV